MTTEDNTKVIRVRLGEAGLKLIAGSSDHPATAVEDGIERLFKRSDKADYLEQTMAALTSRDHRQTEALSKLAAASEMQAKVTAQLHDLLDMRTKELGNVFLHISGLVGSKFAQGEELERIHLRLTEIQGNFDRDIGKLAKIISAAERETQEMSKSVKHTIEEEKLAVPLPQEHVRDEQQRGRGHER